MKINTQAIKKVCYSILIVILFLIAFSGGLMYFSIRTNSQDSFKERRKELVAMHRNFYSSRVEQSAPMNDFTYMNYAVCEPKNGTDNLFLLSAEQSKQIEDQSSMHREYPESTPYGVELASRIYKVIDSIMN